ncbi:MAG: hypothetical protein HRU20_04035 [Pseudomonadales bacterium]|nr:hypothetical protein [Pseudomonadales bacterium]
MTLKKKFLQVIALVIVSIITIAVVAGLQFKQILSDVEMIKNVDEIALNFSDLRKSELNFFASGDASSADVFEEQYSQLDSDFSQLIEEADNQGISTEELKKMKSIVEAYYFAFADVIDVQTEIGLSPTSGLYGELRTAVHTAEGLVKEAGLTPLYRDMLLLRRYEKDFMLRKTDKYIQKFNQQMQVFNTTLEGVPVEGTYTKIKAAMAAYASSFRKLTLAEKEKGFTSNSGMRASLSTIVVAAEASGLKARNTINEKVNEDINSAIFLSISIMCILGLLIVLAFLWVASNVSKSVIEFKQSVQDFVADLQSGDADLSKRVEVTGFKEIEDLSSSFNDFTRVLAEQTEKTQALMKSSEVVKQAFDNASTPAMIVESNGIVSYVNRAMYDFIQKHAASFAVNTQNMREFPLLDLCNSAPEFIQSIAGLKQAHLQRIQQSGLTIDWQVTPIVAEDNSINSHVIEWDDQTEQIKIEVEVEDMITAAKAGDFTQSIVVDGKTGFFLQVSEGLNEIVSSVDTSLSDVSSVLTAISDGDLNNHITNEYSGKLGELAQATNSMVKQLSDVISDVSEKVAAAKRGDFDTRISESGKRGFYLSITEDLNEQGQLIDSAMLDVSQVLRAISEGDLSVKVNQKYEGRIFELSEYANSMVTQLSDVVGKISESVGNSAKGDFTTRIQTSGQKGFYLQLSDNLNNLNQTTESAMQELIETLSAMAAGDLTKTINKNYEGIFNDLKRDTNATINNLVEVMAGIQQGSASVKQAADEISQGNLDLSRRTEQQAASLEETASSMEQMTATIIQNTESSKNASHLANKTRQVAEDSGRVVDKAVIAMGEISESSGRINDIISVIDEIAFQTNLLALNASVEAARAGEQGRGFAVVAGEVRNLAGRSATAAKEIKDLIEDSVKKVDEGKDLVNKSGESLTNIMNSVKEVSDLVAEIATASEEQSMGISEVNRAVTKMDEMTQQNAALVEEVASTSDAMGGQASELEQRVSFFKINANAAARATSTPSMAAAAPVLSPAMSVAAAPAKTTSSSSSSSSISPPEDEDWAEF